LQDALPDRLRISASTNDDLHDVDSPAPAPLLSPAPLLPVSLPAAPGRAVPGALFSSVSLLRPSAPTHARLAATLTSLVAAHRADELGAHGPISEQDVMIATFMGNMSCLPPR
jgi:hypothetical protein